MFALDFPRNQKHLEQIFSRELEQTTSKAICWHRSRIRWPRWWFVGWKVLEKRPFSNNWSTAMSHQTRWVTSRLRFGWALFTEKHYSTGISSNNRGYLCGECGHGSWCQRHDSHLRHGWLAGNGTGRPDQITSFSTMHSHNCLSSDASTLPAIPRWLRSGLWSLWPH